MDELERLASLQGLEILDTESEQAFDRLTQLAAGALGVPIAAVTLVDEARVWLKSRLGTEMKETDRKGAFCSSAVECDTVFVVEDASRDHRFSDTELVARDGVRFYAGAPIKLATGAVVGTVCTFDLKPKERPSTATLALLEGLAIAAGHLLDLRRELVVRREINQALREHTRLLELAENMAGIGTWRLDFRSGAVRHSHACNKIYGFDKGVVTRDADTLLAMYDPADRAKLIAQTDEARRTGCGFSFDACLRRIDGVLRNVRGQATVEVDADGKPAGLIGVFRDVTVEVQELGLLKEKHAEADRRAFRMRELALTDALTGLLNRRAFLERVEDALSDGSGTAMVILDLDHFKSLNDRYGHDAGDAALRAFGAMCTTIADKHCVAGRIGGEEFAILLSGCDENVLIERVARLRALAAETPVLSHDKTSVCLTFSAGLATVSPGDDWHSLFRRADRALYMAKSQGRDRLAVAA